MSENVKVNIEETTPAAATVVPESVQKPPTVADQVAALLSTEITNQNLALNVLVGWVGVAQRRGVFAIDESAKIYECIRAFQGDPPK